MISSRPSQYIKGWVEFYKLKFKVTPDVLIPRPETELLVDEVLANINYISNKKGKKIVLDVGTGSGNIAISVAKNSRDKDIKVIASDVSIKALKIANKNAKLHAVEKQIRFIQSNLLQNFKIQNQEDDTLIIVTNLPYIPTSRIPYLDSSVKDFEPYIALNGGEDGFELYRKLFSQINKFKLKPRLIIGEIDYTHGELAVNEALKYFSNAKVEVKTDLAHKQRILKISL